MPYAFILIFLETLSLINSFSFPVIFPQFRLFCLFAYLLRKTKLSLSFLLLYFFVIIKNIQNSCLRLTFYEIMWTIVLIAKHYILLSMSTYIWNSIRECFAKVCTCNIASINLYRLLLNGLQTLHCFKLTWFKFPFSTFSFSFPRQFFRKWHVGVRIDLYDRLSNAIVTTEFETRPLDIKKLPWKSSYNFTSNKHEAPSRILSLSQIYTSKNHADDKADYSSEQATWNWMQRRSPFSHLSSLLRGRLRYTFRYYVRHISRVLFDS